MLKRPPKCPICKQNVVVEVAKPPALRRMVITLGERPLQIVENLEFDDWVKITLVSRLAYLERAGAKVYLGNTVDGLSIEPMVNPWERAKLVRVFAKGQEVAPEMALTPLPPPTSNEPDRPFLKIKEEDQGVFTDDGKRMPQYIAQWAETIPDLGEMTFNFQFAETGYLYVTWDRPEPRRLVEIPDFDIPLQLAD